MPNMIKLALKLIKSGRYDRLLRAFQSTALAIYKIPIFGAVKKKIGRAGIFVAYKTGNTKMVEKITLEHSKQFKPSFDIIDRYISLGTFTYFEEIASSAKMPADVAAIIRAGALQAEGQADEAIALLTNVEPRTFLLRKKVALTLRNIYRQKREHGKAASVMMGFLNSEETRILITLAISAAASAEAANDESLFASSISRVLADIELINQSDRLFKKYWKEAIAGSLAIFDVEGAIRIAERANERSAKAGNILADTLALRSELISIMHVIREAHADILRRCGRFEAPPSDGEVVIVVPGAAVRTNNRDYFGFRSDIRKSLINIVKTLEADGISYTVRSRIWNHNSIDYDKPFFSYHTVSNSSRGLHFKETDRPSLFSFDSRGYAGWSAFAKTSLLDMNFDGITRDKIESFFEQDRQLMIGNRISKYAQRDVTENLPGRFIFVALQVMGDAVQSLAYMTPFSMLDEVIATAKLHRISVVVKRHPACKSVEIGQYLEGRKQAGEIVVTVGNIHDIIPASQAVCVVNSGVGAEALIYEKPVFVFGRSDYMSACFVCEHPGDFEKHFGEGNARLTQSELRKFWYSYRNVYACDLRDPSYASAWIAARVRAHLRMQT